MEECSNDQRDGTHWLHSRTNGCPAIQDIRGTPQSRVSHARRSETIDTTPYLTEVLGLPAMVTAIAREYKFLYTKQICCSGIGNTRFLPLFQSACSFKLFPFFISGRGPPGYRASSVRTAGDEAATAFS